MHRASWNIEKDMYVYPKRDQRSIQRSRFHEVLSIFGIILLLCCAGICIHVGKEIFTKSKSRTSMEDLFVQDQRICPKEAVIYIFLSGVVFAIYAANALIVLAIPSSRSKWMVIVVAGMCMLSIVWGMVGAAWISRKGCAKNEPVIFAVGITSSCLFLTICIPLLGLLLYYSFRSMAPGDEV